MKSLSLLGLACCCLVAVGCSSMTDERRNQEGALRSAGKDQSLGYIVGELPQLNLPQIAVAKPTRAEVMVAYQQVYGMLPGKRDNQAVGKRLADLHMAEGELKDMEGQQDPYQSAIDLYEKLLEQAGGSVDESDKIDQILYQLARAHDLAGQVERTLDYLNRLVAEYPDSPHVPEGRFRRAEIRFSAEDYRSAAEDYRYVVGLGDATPYYRNASYMLGWAEFKRSRFDEGLHQFFNVIGDLLAEHTTEDLSAMENELLDDSFRVITLTLAYLEGAATLAEEMRKRGKPHWQYLAYQRLADDYFNRERFLDNVTTWQTFIEHNSLDARAPAAHIGMIKTLTDAGFPSDVIPKKEEFILRYGVYSEFWAAHPLRERESYLSTLHVYLSEMAALAHAEAQEFDASQARPVTSRKDLGQPDHPAGHRGRLYLAAARWYEEIVLTFPEDARLAEYLFLLGESFTEANEQSRAVAAYQRVVREFPAFTQAHEAGYAAILALEHLVARAPAAERELWQRLKIDAQIEFALVFPGDPRAPAVQTDAADTLFALGNAPEALELAENLFVEWPNLEAALAKTALLIVGHGRFEMDEFAAAEQAYHRLSVMALNPGERDKVHERLLASVYKQAEASEAEGAVDEAVYHFMRIADLDSEAPLAAQGHFDAVAVVEGSGRIAQAASMLAEFRRLYPNHELAEGVDLRLATMYEQTGNWPAAALEYVGLSRHAAQQEVRRQSLYRAAEIYLQQDEFTSALRYFSDYAETYKTPWGLRLEAMHHVDELYQRAGDTDKRRFWLNKKIELYREMGPDATPRATHLAAGAQLVLATEERERFRLLRLIHPLKQSLKNKRKALKRTLRAYEAVAAYEVAEYVTASTYEIADLYSTLSKSIMNSDRPVDLSMLELEQYEILLEEQAFPFEEQAISLHEINMRRAWNGTYDDWVKKSFSELARLMPGRFDKQEHEVAYAEAIH